MRSLFARHSGWVLLDVVLAINVGVVGLTLLPAGLSGPHGIWPALALAAACVAMAVRRRWPAAALVVAVATFLVQVSDASPHWTTTTVLTATMYTLATVLPRRAAIAAGAAAFVVIGVGAVLLQQPSRAVSDSIPLLELTIVVAAVAAGDAARQHRAYLAAVEERARHAEHDREREACRRVAEERVRIAHDLHDVVSHQLALIHVHAGVAAHLLNRHPEQAETALGHVRTASRAALDELAVTIRMLRQPGDPAAPLEPVAGLARLDELIGSLEVAGLSVERTTVGSPRPLPAVVDAIAYRIIQEALTNVRKHARTDTARLSVDYRPAELRMVVDDDGVGAVADVTGNGSRGMIERAAAVGGRVALGPRPDGGFRVAAVLPTPEE